MRASLVSGILAACIVISGCSETIGPEPSPTLMFYSTRNQVAFPGTAVESPQVLVHDGSYHPLAGITVTFTVDGGGSIENTTAVTDAHGIASAGKWIAGGVLTTSRVVASIPGGQSIEFTTVVVPAPPPGEFELSTVDGQPLPQYFWWFEGDVLSGTITFADNATFSEAFTYKLNGAIWGYTDSGSIKPAVNLQLDNFRAISIDGNTLTLTFLTAGTPVGKFVFNRVGTS